MSKKVEHKVTKLLYLVIIVILLFYFVSPFLIPVFFSATVALALFPFQLKLEKKGLTRKHAAGLLTFLFAFIISIPLSFFLIKGTIAVRDQLEKMSLNEKIKDQGVQEIVTDIKHDLVNVIHTYAVKFNVAEFFSPNKVEGYLTSVNNFLLLFFKDFAATLPAIFLLYLVMVLTTYSFLKNGTNIRRFMESLFGFNHARMDELIAIFIKDSRQVYMTNIVTGSIQSLMVATGVTLLHLGDFFLVFFITLILSFVPVIGAAPVAFVFALLAFIKGNTTAAIILGILGAVTGVVDNILRPWLASFGESKIPPIVAFICVIGGALLLGFPGLFIGLLVGSIAYDTVPIFWEELGKSDFFDRS